MFDDRILHIEVYLSSASPQTRYPSIATREKVDLSLVKSSMSQGLYRIDEKWAKQQNHTNWQLQTEDNKLKDMKFPFFYIQP